MQCLEHVCDSNISNRLHEWVGNGHWQEISEKSFSQGKKSPSKALRKAWEIEVSIHQGDIPDTVFILKRDEKIQRWYTNDVEVAQNRS